MIVYPNAKINIGLNITERRADGFHNLETIFYPVPLCDKLTVEKSDEDYFECTGIELNCASGNNLIEKALKLLRTQYAIPPLKIILEKHIPTGAGLGGGSSDAAFFIKAVNQMFKLDISASELEAWAAKLGSDCAFFVDNKPKFATGRGEVMTPVPEIGNEFKIRIFKPSFSISTAEAYSKVKPQKPSSSLKIDYEKSPYQWRNLIKNDFETFLFPSYPLIEDIKNQLYSLGAVYVSMTGSGSAVFAIFDINVDIPSQLKEFVIL